MAAPRKRLGEALIGKGLITEAQLQDALREQGLTKEFLGAILLKRKLIMEKDLLEVLSEQFNIPYVRLQDQAIDRSVARRFTTSLLLDHKCFPIRQDDYSVTVAITNPLNAWAVSELEKEAEGRKVKLILVSEGEMMVALRRHREWVAANIQRLLRKDYHGDGKEDRSNSP